MFFVFLIRKEEEERANEKRLKEEQVKLELEKFDRFLHLKEFNIALECSERALRIDSNCDQALSKKGRALERLNRNDETILCCEMALGLNPKNVCDSKPRQKDDKHRRRRVKMGGNNHLST